MSTHNIQFQDKIKLPLNICFLELSEEFRTKNEFKLTMVNEPSVFELLRFNCICLACMEVF